MTAHISNLCVSISKSCIFVAGVLRELNQIVLQIVKSIEYLKTIKTQPLGP